MIKLKTLTKGARKRPLNLFFAEIIVALLFFSISGAVILKVFASADKRSRSSETLERVIIASQSVAEAYSRYADPNKALETVFGKQGGEIRLDKSCLPDDDGNMLLKAEETITEKQTGFYKKLKLCFTEGEKEIYTLECAAYSPKGGGENA